MQLKNAVISFLLICSYSLGFAHNVIPHCDEAHGNGANHSHEHHIHIGPDETNEEHTHIAHNDHFDDGILELLICALEVVNHHDGACDLEFYTQIKEFNGSEKADNKSVETSVFSIGDNNVFLNRLSNKYSDLVILCNTKEYDEPCPNRGPPFI
jgi:hypothetical protein